MALYQIWNAPAPTTSKVVAVTSGANTLKTLLQVKPSATITAKIKEWGFKCDAPASASLLSVELLETDVAATVTAHVAAGIVKLDAAALRGGDPTTNLFPVGTTSTGYTASGEGTIAATRVFDAVLNTIPSSNGYEFVKQFPLGLEPILDLSLFTRIRVQSLIAVNCLCYITVEI